MAFVCPEKSNNRKNLLRELRCLVDNLSKDENGNRCPCPVPVRSQKQITNCIGPTIAIYDPMPKPCVPICPPAPVCCPPTGGCPPPPVCCPPTPCPQPVPIVNPPPPPICVPPCLPICTPPPTPCIPVCNPCPPEQPCVPCTPPQMMVCYRRPKERQTRREPRGKSRELRASILLVGCDCEKHNGLQDDCLRTQCRGSPECLEEPPTCPPSEFADCKHLGKKGYGAMSEKNKDLEQYQCYPAYVQLPNNNGCGNGNGNCPLPTVPVIAQPPCPPAVAPVHMGCIVQMPVCPSPTPMMCYPQVQCVSQQQPMYCPPCFC